MDLACEKGVDDEIAAPFANGLHVVSANVFVGERRVINFMGNTVAMSDKNITVFMNTFEKQGSELLWLMLLGII